MPQSSKTSLLVSACILKSYGATSPPNFPPLHMPKTPHLCFGKLMYWLPLCLEAICFCRSDADGKHEGVIAFTPCVEPSQQHTGEINDLPKGANYKKQRGIWVGYPPNLNAIIPTEHALHPVMRGLSQKLSHDMEMFTPYLGAALLEI